MIEPAPRKVTSAAELIEVGLEIEGIQFFRLQAEVNDDGPIAEVRLGEFEPSYGLKLRHVGDQLGIRVSITLELISAKIVVDGAVNYVTSEVVDMDEETLLEFANSVGVMAILPYLRQAIADLSQRVLGEVVLMPVIPLGGLAFTRGGAVSG